MIGNSNWMEKSFKPDENSKYKLVYKNVFLADILSQISFDTDKPGVKEKISSKLERGITDSRTYKRLDLVNDAKTKSKKL